MAERKTAKKTSGSEYRAKDIQVLEGLEPVRRRPGMYIGTTGSDGLHHLIWEVFDNGRDEAMGGFASNIEIALLPDNKVRVVDDGRGIPVDVHKQTKVSALETIMTTLHAGGKFGGEGYKVSGGLHGVGVSVVNALSTYLRAEVHRDGGAYVQEYSEGARKKTIKKIGPSKLTGTIIVFEPDPKIFKEISFDWEKIVSHMRQQAYLVKGLRITIIDARGLDPKLDTLKVFYLRELNENLPSMSFCFDGGLLSFVRYHNRYQKPAHKSIFYVDREHENVQVEVSLQYVDDISPRIFAFANNIYNAEGGMHMTGFKTALTRTINTYAKKNNLVKEGNGESFSGDDVLEGLTAVISVKLREIQFEGQTKGKLGSVEARSAVDSVFGDSFSTFLEESPDEARAIIGKVQLAQKARKAAKAAKDSVLRKGVLEGLALPGKLADCQTKNAEEAELFVVEGDSAGGCFSGDTEVALLDGRSLSFKELVREHKQGKHNYCYTIDESNNVQTALIHEPRVTKRNADVIRVVLDNDKEITCTPDHRFMLRSGEYKRADGLTVSDSLMPLRRQRSRIGKRITIKGYELVFTPGDHRWIFTHLLSDRYNVENNAYDRSSGDAVHHRDFNKLNNNPDNLVRVDKQEHLIYHTKNLKRTLHSEESKQKARDAHAKPEYRNKIRKIMLVPCMRAMLSLRAKKQWESKTYKDYMGKKFLEFYHNNAKYRKENRERLTNEQKKYWSSPINRQKQSDRVKKFFEQNPDHRRSLRHFAREQWENNVLREWRSETTKKQWTESFRKMRKEAYNRTYREKALEALHEIYLNNGKVNYQIYDKFRKETKDKSLIKIETICQRFFNGEIKQLEDAVVNYNHRIRELIPLKSKQDVYDLEVEGTHNFALANGVFVHNSGKQGRDRRTQAILPLWGKVLNVERARLDKIVSFRGIKELIIALGTAIGDTFDISKLRYHKIIIATDADVDGAHIRTLLLTLFYRYFRELIEGGYLYIAQPPLYKIKRGKEVKYAYSDVEKDKILGKDSMAVDDELQSGQSDEIESENESVKNKGKVMVQRYKGLGEMNPDELWETTMDPERRILKQVRIEDAQEADMVFDILMGSDVAPRKSFIQTNAKLANLDV